MPSTEKFLDILADRDLLSEKLLASLRQQVAKSPKPIRPEALARRLIDAGHLTPVLAKRLLAALSQTETGTRAAAGDASQPARPAGKTPAAAATGEEEDDLGLAPLEEDDLPRRSSAPKAPKPSAKPSPSTEQQPKKPAPVPNEAFDVEDLDLAPLEDDDVPKRPSAARAAKPSAKPSPSTGQQPKKSAPAEPKQSEKPPPGSSLLDEELAPLGSAGDGLAPLDGLLAAGGMDAAAAAGSPLAPVATRQRGWFGWLKRKRGAVKPRRSEKVWDSPVLLLSGGVLIGLLVLGAVLLWALRRQSGDEVLAAANEEYRAGSYTQAIHKFDQYLRRFPRHQGVSSARVKRGLAQLRQKTLEGGDWQAALATAQEILGKIKPEDAFAEAAGELAAMLPAIAEGLAARAQDTNNPELLALARQALDLAGDRMIVPSRLQPTAKLEELEAQLALVDRQIRQGEEVEAAVAAIEKALAQGDATLAYKTRHELLRNYPAIADDPKLMAATQAISAVQGSLVQVTEEVTHPSADQPASPISATLTLAERVAKQAAPHVEGEVLVVVAAGAAYGFNATDGRLLWKRHLGEAPDGLRTPITPVAAGAAPGTDVFVLAPAFKELWRLDVQTGQPRWRLPLGGRVDVTPVLAKDQLVVATREGRLHLVDGKSGSSIRQIQLPQPIPVAPAVDIERGLIYQAADHSNLFVLDVGSGRCLDVVYLGHSQGSLAAAPALAAEVLLVPVNDRARTAVLRVYDTAGVGLTPTTSGDSEGQAAAGDPLRLLQEFRVRGQFDTSPVVAGRSVVAVTDLGALYAYELGAADPDKPLVPILQRETADTEPLVRYCLFQANELFLADSRLTKFDVRAAEGRLVPQWFSDEQSAFLEPPRRMGSTVFHVRRRIGEPGAMVAAVHSDDGRTLWHSRIAVPPADRPVVQGAGQRIVAANSAGTLFQLEAEMFRGEAVLDEAAADTRQFRRPVCSVIALADGAVVLSAGHGSDQLALFNPDDGPGRYTWRTLPGELTALPVPFQDGVLLPCLPGHLFLLDPRTNEMVAEPFQPPLAPDRRLGWQVPAVGEGGYVAATDGRETLFAVAIEPEPKPHLKSIATTGLGEPVTGPLAAAGNMVFAVDAAPAVSAYELPALERHGQWPLDSLCTWGPFRVGEHVLLATEDGQLLCFDAAAKLCWQVALPETPLAGAAALEGGHFLLATAGGTLWRIAASDGSEVDRIEVQRPLGTAPVPIGQEVLVGGRAGSLYRVKVPQ